MDWLPLQVDVRNRRCLIVGGGEVAARKCELLLRAGAIVTVIAPELCIILQERLHAGEFIYSPGTFAQQQSLINSCFLVIAATNEKNVNQHIAESAQNHGILVNVVDDGAASSVIFPALIDRAPVTIAIGSNGYSALLARTIKSLIEIQLPANLGIFAQTLKALHKKMMHLLPSRQQRQVFLQKTMNDFLTAKLVLGHSSAQALKTVENALTSWALNIAVPIGQVYIIGAGPGDPELLTLKAYRILQNCDVVLYDHLVAPAILEYIRRDAKKILVGKRAGDHHSTQPNIHQQLLQYAQEGLQVVRLKGGDPALFARFGEEAEFLTAQQIPFDVIPGITAALGCAASLKIPLTHRDLASGCLLVTAHHCREKMPINWSALAKSDYTLVFYMGVKSIPEISTQLLAAGMSPQTPLAIVIDGTRLDEKVWMTTLAEAPQAITEQSSSGPGLIIVGEVLRLFNMSQKKNEMPISQPQEENAYGR